MKKCNLMLIILLVFITTKSASADIVSDVTQLQQRWAEVNYQLEGNLQLTAFEQLMEVAENITTEQADEAAAWIWSGIIKSTYAGARGGLGALKFAKQARADFELALDIDADALAGSAYTSLGTLYFSVPGWPIGFGNNDKAEELLLQALTLNPDGIDSNYFYGLYLINEKRFEEARQFLLKAKQATPRINRPVADAGRQDEISQALVKIQDK